MDSENEQHAWIREMPKVENAYLHKSRLYETRSNFYIIGRSKNRAVWRVLKIDRSEASELRVIEDSTLYTESECSELLRRIHVGNEPTGGLKFVTACYGIVGFVKFLGPYYMLIITKRRKIGVICGHAVYAIAQSKILPITNSTNALNVAVSKNENRSFVNSACKCKMYLVFFWRRKANRSQELLTNRCIMITIDFNLGCAFTFLVFTYNLIHCFFARLISLFKIVASIVCFVVMIVLHKQLALLKLILLLYSASSFTPPL